MQKHLFAGTALSLALICQPAMAQDAGAAGSDTGDRAAEQRTGGLDVITVTAQRREETLQDAAIPINAATGDQLELAGVVDATALNRIAPALYVVNSGGANPGYFVRGVGNFTNNGYTNPAIAFNIDGVYIGRPSSTIASFLDLNRVEVLKGPQGTLYGRNATGGAVNVIPNAPELGVLSGEVSGQYGNYDAYQLTAVLNAPIGERVAVRLAGTMGERDGFYDDGTGDADDLALRGQLLFEVSDMLDIRLSADYSTTKGVGPGVNVDGVYVFSPFNPAATIPNWNFVQAPDNVSQPFTGIHTPQAGEFIRDTATAAPLYSPVTGYAYPSRDDEFWGMNAEVNLDLGDVDLVVIPAYRESRLDNQFNGAPFRGAVQQDLATQFSVEARASGALGQLDWLLGAYYFDESVSGLNSYNQFSTVSFNRFDTDTESTAVFGRLTYNLSDDFRLVGGLRYTDEARSIDARVDSVAGVCLIEPAFGPPSCPQVPNFPVGLTLRDTLEQLDPALFPAGSPLNADPIAGAFPYGPFGMMGPQALLIVTPTDIVRDSGDEEVTYRLAAEYDITPDNLVYASFETGFRAGGFNITVGQEEYDPEYIDAWTLGSKNSFFDNRLQMNLEVFYWEYRGQQLAALGVDGRGNNSFYTRNVGESSITGAEMDFQFLATPNTLLRGNVQYLDATYDSFSYNQVDLSDATDPPNFLTPVTGCDAAQVLGPQRSFDIDCSGKPALNAPEWTLNLGIEQTVPLGDLELTGAFDSRYRSNRVVGFAYLPTSNSGDDLTLDASLTLRPVVGGWRATAFIRNITDEAMPTLRQVGAGNVSGTVYEPPRTYGLRLGYEF